MTGMRKAVYVLLALATVAVLTFSFAAPTSAHVPGAAINSRWAHIAPVIDGAFSFPNEWSDAAVIDLQAADPNNQLEAYAYFKNDAQFLYICVDVPGDATSNADDESAIAFDTGHDGVYTAGHDDTFDIGLWGTTWHLVSSGGPPTLTDCSPLNPGLPLHTGLAGARGFGVSPNEQITPHRIFEYTIPLALILASPGDTIGFGGDGTWWFLAWDDATRFFDQWPKWTGGPMLLEEYGDLVLASPPPPPIPSVSQWGAIGMGIALAGMLVWRLRRRTASL